MTGPQLSPLRPRPDQLSPASAQHDGYSPLTGNESHDQPRNKSGDEDRGDNIPVQRRQSLLPD